MENKLKKLAERFQEKYSDIECLGKAFGCFAKPKNGESRNLVEEIELTPRQKLAVDTLEYLLEFYSASKLLKLTAFSTKLINESALNALSQTNREGKPYNATALINASRKYPGIGKILYNFNPLANSTAFQLSQGNLQTIFDNFEKTILDAKTDNYYSYSIAFAQSKDFPDVALLCHNLAKNHTQIPTAFLRNLINYSALSNFSHNAVFKYFKKETSRKRYKKAFINGKPTKVVYNIYDELLKLEPAQQARILNFARAIGCFSMEYLHDKNGKITNETFAQKASVAFSKLYEKQAFPIFEFNFCVDLKYDSVPSEKLLAFLGVEDEKGELQNVKILNELQEKYYDIIERTIEKFDKIETFRHQSTAENPNCTLPWKQAIEEYYRNSNGYINIDNVREHEKPLAKLFNDHNMKIQDFKEAAKYLENAIEYKVPEHILGREIKGKSKNFSFEFLNKHDPKNFIIGIYADCCATLNSSTYGATIAKQTVINPNVQNIVVRRNGDGKIIAKGALYLNKKAHYAVINDFELDEKYKRFELENDCGYYRTNTPAGAELETIRKEIFDTFMLAVHAFANEYNRQNPNNNLQRVHIGSGYNRLKSQCSQMGIAKKRLEVPPELSFQDAEGKQFVLYDYKRDKLKTLFTNQNKSTELEMS